MRPPAENNSKGAGSTNNRAAVEHMEGARAMSTPIGHNRYLKINIHFKILQVSMRRPLGSRARWHRSRRSTRATLWRQ